MSKRIANIRNAIDAEQAELQALMDEYKVFMEFSSGAKYFTASLKIDANELYETEISVMENSIKEKQELLKILEG